MEKQSSKNSQKNTVKQKPCGHGKRGIQLDQKIKHTRKSASSYLVYLG